MLEFAYIFLLVGCIPFFRWQQKYEGRNLVSALITGLFLIAWLASGTFPLTWDNTTIAVLCFSAWMIASMFWTYSRQSAMDIYTLFCCLTIFLITRRMTFDILMPILFVPGLVFAGVSLYYYNLPIIEAEDQRRKWPIFGNSNHVGAFLLVPLFVGLWLSFNISFWFYIPTIIICVAIALNQCRGSQLGALTGLLFVSCTQTKLMLVAIPIILVAAIFLCRKRITSILHRFSVLIAALMIIKKAPIAGHGLRTFRREYPNIIPELLDNKSLNSIFNKDVRKDKRTSIVEQKSSHRIHNDLLEIVLELGLIGLVLFIAIFTSLSWDNYFFAGAVIAFAIHGLFFFPLREAHTAFPFFALLGTMAATSQGTLTINPVIIITLCLIISKIIYQISIKTQGLYLYGKACNINAEPNIHSDRLDLKIYYLNKAISCDPYNNMYLTDGYYFNVFHNPEIAFQYASKCMENYDGGKVRWGVADQYARALLRLGGFGVAKMAVNFALSICPDFKQSKELLKQINAMENQGKA